MNIVHIPSNFILLARQCLRLDMRHLVDLVNAIENGNDPRNEVGFRIVAPYLFNNKNNVPTAPEELKVILSDIRSRSLKSSSSREDRRLIEAQPECHLRMHALCHPPMKSGIIPVSTVYM